MCGIGMSIHDFTEGIRVPGTTISLSGTSEWCEMGMCDKQQRGGCTCHIYEVLSEALSLRVLAIHRLSVRDSALIRRELQMSWNSKQNESAGTWSSKASKKYKPNISRIHQHLKMFILGKNVLALDWAMSIKKHKSVEVKKKDPQNKFKLNLSIKPSLWDYKQYCRERKQTSLNYDIASINV